MNIRPTDLQPGEELARCFFFTCDGCGWRLACWWRQCSKCAHEGCTRTDLSPPTLDTRTEAAT